MRVGLHVAEECLDHFLDGDWGGDWLRYGIYDMCPIKNNICCYGDKSSR